MIHAGRNTRCRFIWENLAKILQMGPYSLASFGSHVIIFRLEDNKLATIHVAVNTQK